MYAPGPGSAAVLSAVLTTLVAAPVSAATLTGTVSADRLPPAVPAAITHDSHVCGQKSRVWSSTVSADGRGQVAEVIVYLEARPPSDARTLLTASPKRTSALLVDQVDCAFVPAVGALVIGGELRVRSSDPVFHNVHVRRADGTTVANVSTPLAGTEVTALIPTKPGPLVLGCDAGHHWMRADILVLEHGFFDRTGPGGRFRIDGVPAGTWWLVAWHPRLGERRVPVDVSATDRQLKVALAY